MLYPLLTSTIVVTCTCELCMFVCGQHKTATGFPLPLVSLCSLDPLRLSIFMVLQLVFYSRETCEWGYIPTV